MSVLVISQAMSLFKAINSTYKNVINIQEVSLKGRKLRGVSYMTVNLKP